MKTISDLQKESGKTLEVFFGIMQSFDDRLTKLEKGSVPNPMPEPIPNSSVPFKNMLGINVYPWNFTQDPKKENIGITDRIFEPKFDQLKIFSGFRHYIDWEKLEDSPGQYSYNPTRRGSWMYDLIFQRSKEEGIFSLACIKEPVDWLYKTWPLPHDAQNIPATYGVDLEDPLAYLHFSKMGFQYAARHGANKNVPPELVKVNSKPRWPHDPVNEVKIGLDICNYVECDNERDRWWLPEKRGFSTGRQYAAQLSAFYDGHKGTLGKDAGVKTADPTMKVVMGGLADPSIPYVDEMMQWCLEERGIRPDGSIDICWDVINYHQYSNDAIGSKQWQPGDRAASRGKAPELTTLGAKAKEFVSLSKILGMPVWVTETGYDVFPTPQSANPIGNKSAEQVQADWIIRTSLLYSRLGIEKVFYYQIYDDNPGSGVQYSSSGVAEFNETVQRLRPAAEFVDEVTLQIGEYSFLETLSTNPEVDVYQKGNEYAYVCWIADEKGREMNYTLTKKDGSKIEILVTETPIIVK